MDWQPNNIEQYTPNAAVAGGMGWQPITIEHCTPNKLATFC